MSREKLKSVTDLFVERRAVDAYAFGGLKVAVVNLTGVHRLGRALESATPMIWWRLTTLDGLIGGDGWAANAVLLVAGEEGDFDYLRIFADENRALVVGYGVEDQRCDICLPAPSRKSPVQSPAKALARALVEAIQERLGDAEAS
jgi:hypothetical protein